MQVKIGSTNIKADGYVLRGSVAGQGAYLVRNDAATGVVTLSVPAADASLPAKYSAFLYIDDAAYGGTASRAFAQMTVLRGTPASSPVEPSPAAAWSAYARLWTWQLAASASAVTNSILDAGTDLRAEADLVATNRQVVSTSDPSGTGTDGDLWAKVV
jgi:hypothetical protein